MSLGEGFILRCVFSKIFFVVQYVSCKLATPFIGIILHVIIPVYYMYMYLSMYLHCTLHWDDICTNMYLAYIHCGRSVVFVFVIEDSV